MEKQKLLIQVQGSPRDPSYNDQMVFANGEKIPFQDYFHRNGIKTLEKTLVTSCHGNTELTVKFARDIQKLADEGHKVAVIAQGGLYFALPSIIAANAPTVPVISIPLDGGYYEGLDAFLAPQVPPGTAAIGGVRIGEYNTAAKIAKVMLANELGGVYLFNTSKRLEIKLGELGVPILGIAGESLKSGLVIGCLNYDNEELFNDVISEAPNIVGILTPQMGKVAESAIELMPCFPKRQSVYVCGEDNLAFFAAKIVSAYNEKARDALKESAEKKAKSYEKREINLDSFVGGK